MLGNKFFPYQDEVTKIWSYREMCKYSRKNDDVNKIYYLKNDDVNQTYYLKVELKIINI